MQPVYNDGTLGEKRDFDLKMMEELLENKNVNHINVFNKQAEYEGEKADPEKRIELSEDELEEKIRKIIKEEEQRRDILNIYEKIKKNT